MTLEQVKKLAESDRINKRPDIIREDKEYKRLLIENIDFNIEDSIDENDAIPQELNENLSYACSDSEQIKLANDLHITKARKYFSPSAVIVYICLLGAFIYFLFPIFNSHLHDVTLTSQSTMMLPVDVVKQTASEVVNDAPGLDTGSEFATEGLVTSLVSSNDMDTAVTIDAKVDTDGTTKNTSTYSDGNRDISELEKNRVRQTIIRQDANDNTVSSLNKITTVDLNQIKQNEPDVREEPVSNVYSGALTDRVSKESEVTAENNGSKKVALLMHRAILDAVAFGRNASYVQKKENDLSSLQELHALTSDRYYLKQITLTKDQVKKLKTSLRKLSAVYAERIENICNFRSELIPDAFESINEEFIKSQGIERISLDFFKSQLSECPLNANARDTALVLSKRYSKFMKDHLTAKGRNQ
jgi:hypothetical protein